MARVTTLAAVAGVACGVAAMIIALSLANGFRDEMRDRILRGTAHITLARRDGQPISDWRALARRVAAVEGVSDVSATTYDGALLIGPKGSAYAVLRGLDRESAQTVDAVRQTVVNGSLDPVLTVPEVQGAGTTPQVIIGEEPAARTGLRAGDMASLVPAEATRASFGLATPVHRVRVAGIFRLGLYEYDASWVYLSLDSAADLLGLDPNSASVISIEVRDIFRAGEAAARVRSSIGDDYSVIDWQQANRPLFSALELERRAGMLIIGLIVLVASLNITATLGLVVAERRADIAILGAMGARGRNLMMVFLIEGAALGVCGVVPGIALGLVACLVGDRYHLVRLPSDVYSLASVPFHPHVADVALAGAIAFILSVLATIYPSRAAARLRPVRILRDG